MSLVLRRTALFVVIVLVWALVAAAVAHASVREIAPIDGCASRSPSIGLFTASSGPRMVRVGTPVDVLG